MSLILLTHGIVRAKIVQANVSELWLSKSVESLGGSADVTGYPCRASRHVDDMWAVAGRRRLILPPTACRRTVRSTGETEPHSSMIERVLQLRLLLKPSESASPLRFEPSSEFLADSML